MSFITNFRKEVEKSYEPLTRTILDSHGFKDVKRMPDNCPYDFEATKDGKLCLIELRSRSQKAKSQFFTVRDTKIRHLREVRKEMHADVYFLLINKYGHKLLTFEELLSGKHKEVHFFKYTPKKGKKPFRAYYWRNGTWKGTVPFHVTVDKASGEWVDMKVKEGVYRTRSHAVQVALKELRIKTTIKL